MRIGHHISRYAGSLFATRLLSLLLTLLGILLFIETLAAKKRLPHGTLLEQISLASAKVPLLVHKTLPFMLFGAGILLFFRLLRYQELPSMYSAGASLWRIMCVPILVTALVGCADLFFLTPLSNAWLAKYQHLDNKKHMLQDMGAWSLCQSPTQTIVVHKIEQGVELYFFTPEFFFTKQLTAKHATFNGEHIQLKDVWLLQKGLSPQFIDKTSVQDPTLFMQCTSAQVPHPSMMSFMQAHNAIFSTPSPQRLAYFRWHYLLANVCWMMSLVLLAASLVVGKTSRMKQVGNVFMGACLCFGLYVCREWLYALSVLFSYLISPIFLWIVPLMTLLITLLILFEKNEL